jgi:hypothetical protein
MLIVRTINLDKSEVRAMGRGASFHLVPVGDPASSEVHNTRSWELSHPAPGYLLPDEHHATLQNGKGFARVIAHADPRERHAEKMWLASGKAKSMDAYSPLWEGVLNLPHPTPELRGGGYEKMVKAFVDDYERITAIGYQTITGPDGKKVRKEVAREGHKVLVADVHTDEGRVEDGAVKHNVHAHITVDRTDARGRPIRLTDFQLREIQDLAAAITGLDRGDPAETTKRKHIKHQGYRGLAKAGRLLSREDSERLVNAEREHQRQLDAKYDEGKAAGLRDGLVKGKELGEAYGYLRGLMMAAGGVTQEAYQLAKRRHEAGDSNWISARTAELEKFIEARRVKEAAKLEKAEKGQEAAEKLASELKKTLVEAKHEKAHQKLPGDPSLAPAPEPAKPLRLRPGPTERRGDRNPLVAGWSPERLRDHLMATRSELEQRGLDEVDRLRLLYGRDALAAELKARGIHPGSVFATTPGAQLDRTRDQAARPGWGKAAQQGPGRS